MQLLPPLTTAHALFLDFDGTLTELAPRPDAVRVASGLAPTLSALQALLGGALAIVTGRTEADIDGFLAPLRLPLASERVRIGERAHVLFDHGYEPLGHQWFRALRQLFLRRFHA